MFNIIEYIMEVSHAGEHLRASKATAKSVENALTGIASVPNYQIHPGNTKTFPRITKLWNCQI